MKEWLILLTICIAWSLMWVDFTAVNVALPAIAYDLHTNLDTLQWVITAYTLSSAALMAVGGRLGDMFGHRRLFVTGTLIFVLSSALAGFASTASLLILSRVGQGIGIALVVPITTALVYLTFKEKQKGLALGFLTGTTGISMAIGPTVGGILITYLSWRWVFFINIPTGLFAVVMAFMLVKETREKKNIQIDFPGMITLSSALVSFLFALNKFPQWGLSVEFVSLILFAFFLFVLFINIELRSKDPLIHVDLLTQKRLISLIMIRTCAQYIFFVYMFVISLYIQNILGFNADATGYILLAATAALGILSPFSGHLINYLSLRFLIAASCFILMLSLGFLIYTSLSHTMIPLIISLIFFGIAFAIHFPATNFAALQIAHPKQSALVTGMLFTMAFAGASAGITLSSALLNTISQNKLTQYLFVFSSPLSEKQTLILKNTASGAQSLKTIAATFPANLINQATAIVERSFTEGFIWVIVVCVFLTGIGTGLALLTLKDFRVNPKKKEYVLDI